MSVLKFPLNAEQSTGVFWLAGTDPSGAVGGVCRVSGSDIEIEVTSPLTPWMEWDSGEQSVRARRIPEEKDLVLFGQLPVFPGPLTFVGARTVARRATTVPGASAGPELHRLKADWCVASVHLEKADMQFSAVRARFTHLELWARTQDLEMTQRTTRPLQTTVVYSPVDATVTAFSEYGESASMRLTSGATVGMPGPWGTFVKTFDWLELDGLSGWTIAECLTRFIRPVQNLLTLLAGEACEILQIEVKADDRWCAVYGSPVKPMAPQPEDQKLLLDKAELPLEQLASWCGLVGKLSPVPYVVASATAKEFATVETEALALTTTAEGLDRVLYPNARRFTAEDVEATIGELEGTSIPETVRAALVQALKQYFYEDSYPTRMGRLAEYVSAVASTCIGRPNRWKSEITSLRIDLAHALGQRPGSSDEAILLMHARNQSLRWALLIRILLETGVPPEVLSRALEESERYRRDSKRWRRQLPNLFPSESL
ncbi:HEPN domain-containing protein [Kribbella sp. NPDC023855]|uniref:ApeA N-terminal domain 1-containing protein n=1 Tax=Kribbella sp. NPDC023855 TaxID=3154698 RepID=UPI0033F36A05